MAPKTANPRPKHIHPNDRICFLGDSITEQKLYTNYVETYLATRWPELKLTFFNAGWGGDTSPGGLARLERDVLSLRPTLVTLCYGMNDGRYVLPTAEIRTTFANGLASLVRRLKAARIRVVLLTPGCVCTSANPGLGDIDYNGKGLRVLANEVLKLARRERLPAFDLLKLMREVDARAKKADPAFTMIPDGVHPDPAGHLVMAHGLLTALGVPPRRQTAHLDLTRERVSASAGVRASALQGGQVQLQLDHLPFHVEPAARKVLPFVPFQQTFNQLLFSASGARPGRWFLRLDPQRSASLTTPELRRGVNLFDLWAHAPAVLAANALRYTNEKDHVYHKLWRDLALNAAAGPYYDTSVHSLGIQAGPRLDRARDRVVAGQRPQLGVRVFAATLPGEPIDNGDFVTTWRVRGPLPRPFTRDHLGGEAAFSRHHPKLNRQWRTCDVSVETIANCLGVVFGPVINCVGYAITVINSPVEQRAELLLGSDDGFAAWLNGALLGENLSIARAVVPDQDRLPIILRKGRNVLLLKISQYTGGWGFCVRFAGLREVVSALRP